MVEVNELIAASRYIQGSGAIALLGESVAALGRRAYIIGGRTALSMTEKRIRDSLRSSGVKVVAMDRTVKDCTYATIDSLVDAGMRAEPDFVIGVGGGRAVDTAKAVAWKLSVPSVSVGTQCATNADASAESVVYTDDREFLESVVLPRSPAVVIVDTEIIAAAPVKFLVWGMGDALSTKFEAEAFAEAVRRRGGKPPTNTALALADSTYQSLMAYGLEAVEDLTRGAHSDAVDEVIEAVKLTSAIAFENANCALAHAIHNGLTRTGAVKREHGEIVAYGTIIQVAYEGRPKDEVLRIIRWCESVGLPTKLGDVCDHDEEALSGAVEYACTKDPNANSMPERPSPEEMARTINRVERGI
ncbi:MAG: glycerol dehydrogenase [Methanobacteriota archaeon]|nr:MAG: glycerol dehydrogenase [Euryarchaeota archaeon]